MSPLASAVLAGVVAGSGTALAALLGYRAGCRHRHRYYTLGFGAGYRQGRRAAEGPGPESAPRIISLAEDESADAGEGWIP